MSESKPVKVEHEKQGLKQRFSDMLDEMWEKIGQHHHGVSGHVASGIAADLSDSKNCYTYSIDLPGMDQNDVEVEVESGRLVIRGEKQEDRKEKLENYVFRERRFGRFERSFTLPANAREKDIKAGFKNGVLTVKIPYKGGKEKASRKIPISGD